MSDLYVARVKRIAARMIGDEMMIMSARDSTLFRLNQTAAIIWQAADGRIPLARIVDESIRREFDVDLETALRDAELLVQGLADHGIMHISTEPIGDQP